MGSFQSIVTGHSITMDGEHNTLIVNVGTSLSKILSAIDDSINAINEHVSKTINDHLFQMIFIHVICMIVILVLFLLLVFYVLPVKHKKCSCKYKLEIDSISKFVAPLTYNDIFVSNDRSNETVQVLV